MAGIVLKPKGQDMSNKNEGPKELTPRQKAAAPKAQQVLAALRTTRAVKQLAACDPVLFLTLIWVAEARITWREAYGAKSMPSHMVRTIFAIANMTYRTDRRISRTEAWDVIAVAAGITVFEAADGLAVLEKHLAFRWRSAPGGEEALQLMLNPRHHRDALRTIRRSQEFPEFTPSFHTEALGWTDDAVDVYQALPAHNIDEVTAATGLNRRTVSEHMRRFREVGLTYRENRAWQQRVPMAGTRRELAEAIR